jgi:predicted lipid-binding transport protein (Tim44 family)
MNSDATVIVFAVVAIFVAWRLWSVLGTRTGYERPPMEPPRAGTRGGTVIDMRPSPPPPPPAERWRGVAEPGGAVARGLDAIAASDPGFDAEHFLAGARSAYEMIINAFAAGNADALRALLAPEPLANFTRAIEARRAAGQTMTTTMESIDDARIVEAGVQGANALVAVKFAAKMTSATLDAQGRVVEGSPTDADEHVEIWTFSRPLSSRDPNWRLASTEAAH